MHKLNKAEFDEKKAAKDELKKPQGSKDSVATLRARMGYIEKVLGIEEVKK